MPFFTIPVYESNDCHNPSGPGGGQFCSTSGGPLDFIAAVKQWGLSRTDVDHPKRADIRIGRHAELDVHVGSALGPRTVLVSALEAFPMRQGHGAAVMQRLTDLADRMGITLALEALPLEPKRGKKIGVEKLKTFYRRFGFETQTSEEHGDAYMFRKPH